MGRVYDDDMTAEEAKRYLPWLFVLMGLFALGVLADMLL